MFTPADISYMTRALRLAERGLYTTTPNPRVGCVLVQDGHVVGEGWHERAGEPHAEIHALRQAGTRAHDATAYVTLEPCSHHGRTPPCADALIQARVKRVVVALRDPNPLVAGQGLARLQQAGIHVQTGLLESEAIELNRGFVARMLSGRPWIRTKLAMSLDGRTALNNGVSQWITGEAARLEGQKLRARACAVMTGSGTVLADNPQLTVRAFDTERQPLRVVIDSRLQTPLEAQILTQGETLIVTASDELSKIKALQDRGIEVIRCAAGNQVDLLGTVALLAERGCNELMVEAGAVLNGALLQAGLIDEIIIFQAPLLLGDSARGLFHLPEITHMQQRRRLYLHDSRRFGDDLRLIFRLRHENNNSPS